MAEERRIGGELKERKRVTAALCSWMTMVKLKKVMTKLPSSCVDHGGEGRQKLASGHWLSSCSTSLSAFRFFFKIKPKFRIQLEI